MLNWTYFLSSSDLTLWRITICKLCKIKDIFILCVNNAVVPYYTSWLSFISGGKLCVCVCLVVSIKKMIPHYSQKPWSLVPLIRALTSLAQYSGGGSFQEQGHSLHVSRILSNDTSLFRGIPIIYYDRQEIRQYRLTVYNRALYRNTVYSNRITENSWQKYSRELVRRPKTSSTLRVNHKLSGFSPTEYQQWASPSLFRNSANLYRLPKTITGVKNVTVHDGAEFKNKLMRVMVYF